MENEKKYEFKYIMALFSNIALLNALEYVKINKKDTNAKKEISESNMKDHFLLNKNWNSLINKHKNKFKKEKIIKSQEIAKNLINFLIYIRNYYSHSNSYSNHKKTKMI